ncbi:hypothetical protein ACG2LH_10685 [Zhouia sp. PK063]|uniref:hypothetical protein n=1 Tax=Zhouia sp. PK063 TaxID=3373602 RepID=UPI003791D911
MKKILLLIGCCLVNLAMAQKDHFTITPKGLQSQVTGENYITLEVKGTPEQLYKNTLLFLHRLYASKKNAITEQDSTLIKLNGYAPKAIRRTDGSVMNMVYNMVFEFDDNAITIDAPNYQFEFDIPTTSENKIVQDTTDLSKASISLYNPAGKLIEEKAALDVVTYFNGFIKNYYRAITHPEMLSN